MAQQDPSSAPPSQGSQSKGSRAFAGVATLLILSILICGVFAGFAGKKIGNEHVEFILAFIFLGAVVLLIFGLAWVDMGSRGPDQGQRHH